MLPHLVTNFEIQKYYQNDSKLNGVYSSNNLPKIKDGAYAINLDEYKSIGTRWIALYVNTNNIVYIDIQYKILDYSIKFIENKNIRTNICRIQAYDSIMFGYFCIGFIDFMLKGKSLLDYTNVFSPNDHQKNDKILIKYFQ